MSYAHIMATRHTFAVCAYRQSPYLRECLNSILSQKGQKSEVYLATSTPSAWLDTIAQEYGLPVYVNAGETGIGQDWNFAYAHALGDYVTIAHQDDVYCEDYAQTVVRMMDASSRPLIFFCDYGELRNAKKVNDNELLRVKRVLLWPLRNGRHAGNKWLRRRTLSLGSSICCPSVALCRQYCPSFPYQTRMQCSLDWDTWEHLSRLDGDFVYANRILMYHRIHEDSATTELIRSNTRSDEDLELFNRFWPAPVARMIHRRYARSLTSNEL